MKCGYVAVLGLPNAGKSSLVNFLVGEEVAVVSHRKQTTRNSILGIKNGKNSRGEEYQMIFVDTPGIHHSKNNLDRYMMKNVRSALGSADVVLYLFDGSVTAEDEEIAYIEKLANECENVIFVETKCDKKRAQQQKLDEFFENKKIEKIKISTFSGENLEKLCEKIEKSLPKREKIFDDDEFTDRSISFLICEKVRGALLEMIDNEIPHGVAVVATSFVEGDDVARIDLEIICEREQHKGIIIGKGGKNLKKIGILTREYAEDLLCRKVVLKIFVKVDPSWRDKNVEECGYKM